MCDTKVLFILKKRNVNWGDSYSGVGVSSGLFNSSSFVKDMLNSEGIESELIEVIDNNCIDKHVTRFKPTHVIIEAYWVVPDKFKGLTKLHPNVKWIIRNHSEIPFLANEGIAFEWTREYVKYDNVFVSCNNRRCESAFNVFVDESKNIYLPNYYPIKEDFSTIEIAYDYLKHYFGRDKINFGEPLHIACPGAIRPLKNQMLQAIAALKVGKDLNRKVYFHVNGSRLEMNGGTIMKNLRALFDNNPLGELVEDSWITHDDFKNKLKKMNVVLQVSYTETFNIVGADTVSVGVPLVSSEELQWHDSRFQADFNCLEDIVEKLKTALERPHSPIYAKYLIQKHVKEVPEIWKNVLGS